MYVCVYVNIGRVCTYMRACVRVCAQGWVYVCMSVWVYVRVHGRSVRACASVDMQVGGHAYACMHAYRHAGGADLTRAGASLSPSLDIRIYVNEYGRECVYVCVSCVYVPVYAGVYMYILVWVMCVCINTCM